MWLSWVFNKRMPVSFFSFPSFFLSTERSPRQRQLFRFVLRTINVRAASEDWNEHLAVWRLHREAFWSPFESLVSSPSGADENAAVLSPSPLASRRMWTGPDFSGLARALAFTCRSSACIRFSTESFCKTSLGVFDDLLQFLFVGGGVEVFPAVDEVVTHNVSPQCENGGTVPTTLFDMRAE